MRSEEMNIEDMTLEEAFEKLDEIIEAMEESELPLEKTFEFYKQGLDMVKYCNDKIEKVECDIKKLSD